MLSVVFEYRFRSGTDGRSREKNIDFCVGIRLEMEDVMDKHV